MEVKGGFSYNIPCSVDYVTDAMYTLHMIKILYYFCFDYLIMNSLNHSTMDMMKNIARQIVIENITYI